MFYNDDENPAVTLYNFWFDMLSEQGKLEPNSDYRPSRWWGEPTWLPRVRYGDYHCGIGVHGYDRQQRPVLQYGAWYSPKADIYTYMAVAADGAFRLINPHGDNHDRMEHHTFLGWGWHGGQYVWYASPVHGPGQNLDTKDWRRGVPYLRERVIRSAWNQPRWLRLDRNGRGQWEILADATEDPLFIQAVNLDRERTARAYRRHQRADVGYVGDLTVRDGKTTLDPAASVLRIAALLDVSQPAKAVPMSKTREVTV